MREADEPIASYLQRRTRTAGSANWEAIADAVNKRLGLEGDEKLTRNSIRKIAYGERPNLGLKVAQALLDHFGAQDAKAKRVKKAGVQ